MSDFNEEHQLNEGVRESFERYWRKSRGEKKHRERLELGQREDGTYVDDSVQRHWWTWQTAWRRAVATDVATMADYEQVQDDHDRLVRELDVLLNGEAGAARQASLCDIVSQVQREGIRSTAVYWHIPHTLAGFVAGYYSQYRCEPTSQDVWDAGFRAARDLLQPFKPQSMDDAIAAMPRYTTPLLDQGVSGLTPEYELHGYLVYETKFGGHWEFHPKDELPAGDFLKHREHKPIYVLAK